MLSRRHFRWAHDIGQRYRFSEKYQPIVVPFKPGSRGAWWNNQMCGCTSGKFALLVSFNNKIAFKGKMKSINVKSDKNADWERPSSLQFDTDSGGVGVAVAVVARKQRICPRAAWMAPMSWGYGANGQLGTGTPAMLPLQNLSLTAGAITAAVRILSTCVPQDLRFSSVGQRRGRCL